MRPFFFFFFFNEFRIVFKVSIGKLDYDNFSITYWELREVGIGNLTFATWHYSVQRHRIDHEHPGLTCPTSWVCWGLLLAYLFV